MRPSGATLVVGTDYVAANTSTEILHDQGYAVSIAHDCDGTFASIAVQPPVLVFLDHHIAALDTTSVLRVP